MIYICNVTTSTRQFNFKADYSSVKDIFVDILKKMQNNEYLYACNIYPYKAPLIPKNIKSILDYKPDNA